MFKIYILLFMVVSTFTYALNISANNPAAIRQIVVAQDQIKLSLQVISDNFSQPRCMCPEATFFNDVKNNNGKFDVYVDKDWLQNSFPDLLQDKNYLSNLYLKNQSVLVLYNSKLNFLKDETIASYKEIHMIGGTITMGEYNRDEKDKFIFEKPIISNFYDENIINTPSKYKITIQNPAALLEAQIGIDDAYLEFQFINHKITLSDEDILSKTFAKMVNHNEGKFHAVIGLDLLKQYVPELVEDQNLVFKSYLNDSVIYGLAGTLDLEIIEGSIKSPRIIKIEFFQSGEYVKSNEDAFNFTGPNDTSYYKAYEEPDFDGIKN